LKKSLLNGLIIPGFDIEILTNLSKNVANLLDLTLEKEKICKIQQFSVETRKNLSNKSTASF
jgi:hypothetical protein